MKDGKFSMAHPRKLVPFLLKKFMKVNLSKLFFMMKELKTSARKNNLKPSWTAYHQWGVKGRSILLRLVNPETPK